MSKVLAELKEKHPDKIEDFYKDQDGWWMTLKDGWCWDPGSHQIHEYSVKDVVAVFRGVEKCDCDWCVAGLTGREVKRHTCPECSLNSWTLDPGVCPFCKSPMKENPVR